jgi:hypothetical protein
VSDKVTVLGKRQLCVVKCKRKDLLSTSIVEKNVYEFQKFQKNSTKKLQNCKLKATAENKSKFYEVSTVALH